MIVSKIKKNIKIKVDLNKIKFLNFLFFNSINKQINIIEAKIRKISG